MIQTSQINTMTITTLNGPKLIYLNTKNIKPILVTCCYQVGIFNNEHNNYLTLLLHYLFHSLKIIY